MTTRADVKPPVVDVIGRARVTTIGLRAAAAATVVALAVGCSAEDRGADTHVGTDAVGRSRAAIVHGTPSDASQDAVVLVIHYDALQKGGGAANNCTGTLLTPRLVLTARHCVALTDPGAACDRTGAPIAGGVVQGDFKADRLFVFAGKDRPDFIAGTAKPVRGKELLTTGAETLCDNDIALILLEGPVEGGAIAPIRLDAPPAKAETVTAVGWGITETTSDPAVRMQRVGVTVTDVGPAEGLGPKEFLTGEGTCSGDSGGPAIAASGAVLGALSRGGNGSGVSGADGCIDGINIYSSVSAHADLLRRAYEKAGQDPWLEGQPNPTLAKLAEACATDAACQSNVCDVDEGQCTLDCTTAACPDGWACADRQGRRLCAPAPKDEGCSTSGGPTPTWTWAAAAFALLLLRRRR